MEGTNLDCEQFKCCKLPHIKVWSQTKYARSHVSPTLISVRDLLHMRRRCVAVFRFSRFQWLLHAVLANRFICSRCTCFVIFLVPLLTRCWAGSSVHGGWLKGLTSSIALSIMLGNSRARFSRFEQCGSFIVGVFAFWMLGPSQAQIGWMGGKDFIRVSAESTFVCSLIHAGCSPDSISIAAVGVVR